MAKQDLPLAYRFGGAFFCELPFHVNENVLIPRFDTERLVETAILNIREGSTVLDMCTGSGCIAVVLAIHKFKVTAVDICRKALRIAHSNEKLHRVNIDFVRSDLFEKLCDKQGEHRNFDAIVSNPPYIRSDDIGRWDRKILFEPRIALDGGKDGMCFYREIIAQAPKHLNPNGQIFFEIDHEQSEDIKQMLLDGGFKDIKIVKDIQGLNRVVHGRKI